jgi:hypothetical protein
MKTTILAAVAALGLSVGAAYAQGLPAGSFQERHYAAQTPFTNHTAEKGTQFLGSDTVLGKMFRYNSDSDHQMAATVTPAKGG